MNKKLRKKYVVVDMTTYKVDQTGFIMYNKKVYPATLTALRENLHCNVFVPKLNMSMVNIPLEAFENKPRNVKIDLFD